MGVEDDHRGIAIIGMACRFPGANNIDDFWSNLCAGVDSISHFDEADLLKAGVASEDLQHPDYVRASPIIDDYDKFDAGFFEYSPREARLMDPQQRILLEEAWHAFEDAGYVPGEFTNRVGAFVGSGGVVSSYLLAQAALHGGTTGGVEHLANDKDFLSTKLSYKLGLTGPSVNVQTACSTALVAVHLACQSILDGECEMAIAGASVVRVPHISGYVHRSGDILSPDGKCRAYDAAAEGTVFGSGAGVVVLKHVEDALADGDHIYAVILGSAINNDGGQKMSFTASSTEGQEVAMSAALGAAEVAPSTLGYIEGHGTGTIVGDPLEVEALRRCFQRDPDTRPSACFLGSVKTNIGHLEQAAGVASLIKAALAVHHGQVPPSLNFEKPNPRINLESSPFTIPSKAESWPEIQGPRRAAVNSLGLGGTNAFAVLQQPPSNPDPDTPLNRPVVLPISAHSQTSLHNSVEAWRDHLGALNSDEVPSSCYTAAVARKSLPHRFAVAGETGSQLNSALTGLSARKDETASRSKLAFLFPGQGTQYFGMARTFLETEASFREAFEGVAVRLSDGFDINISAAIYEDQNDGALNHTSVTQPALFAIEWALASMLKHWGIIPDLVLGHSVGAYAAAAVAGIYDWQTATDLIAHRARLMGELPAGGTMVAVFADGETVSGMCNQVEGVSVAVFNSQANTIVAGDKDAVAQLARLADQQGIPTHPLDVSHAFHTQLMAPAAAAFEKVCAEHPAQKPALSFVSDMTGDVLTEAPTNDYLARHILNPVRFDKGLATLLELGCTTFVEVGPGAAMRSFLAADHPGASDAAMGLLDTQNGDWDTTARTLARLWEKHHPVDFKNYYAPCIPRRSRAPLYAFERKRYWLDDKGQQAAAETRGLIGQQIRLPGDSHHFQATYGIDQKPWLADHRVYDQVTLPVAAALIGMLEVAQTSLPGSVEVRNLTYQEACLFSEEGSRVLNFDVTKTGDAIRSTLQGLHNQDGDGDEWRLYCDASISSATPSPLPVANLADLKAAHSTAVKPTTYYAALDQLGLNYGPGFRNVRGLHLSEHSALAHVRLAEKSEPVNAPMHPAMLDACLHLFPAAIGEHGDFASIAADEVTTYLPITVERFALHAEVPDAVWSLCTLRTDSADVPGQRTVDIKVLAEDGTLVADLTGLTVKRIDRESFIPSQQDRVDQWLYGVDWVECPSLPMAEAAGLQTWLIVADDLDTINGVAEAAQQVGVTCCTIAATDVLNKAPGALPATVDKIIVATSLAEMPLALCSPSQLTESSRRQFDLTKALLQLATETLAGEDKAPRLWYLTRGAQAPLKDHLAGEAMQAVYWGHGRAVAQEYPNSWGGLIDLDEMTHADLIVQQLLAEDGEDQVALRADRRYAPRLVRRGFDGYDGALARPIKQDANYLITGGLGALGLKVAEWLVHQHGAGHICLVSRRHPNAEQNAVIDDLRRSGAEIDIRSADISDETQVAELIDLLGSNGPPLDGVFHCAGLLDDGIIMEMDWERYQRVTKIKIEGSWALHCATQHLPLNHFVMFSSILSVIGSMGQLNYVSGNAFQDQLTHYRRRLGLAATAMNWGPWESSGLAVEAGERGEAIWRARGTRFIPAEIGLQAMHTALVHDQDHLVVTHTDWSRFVSQFAAPPKLYDLLHDGSVREGRQALEDLGQILVQLEQSDTNGRRALLFNAVEQICVANLELDEPAAPHISLRELGLDSLMAITVINDIENIFGVRLAAKDLLRGPSTEELVALVAQALPRFFDPESQQIDPADFKQAAAQRAGDGGSHGGDSSDSGERLAHLRAGQSSGSWLVVQRPRPAAAYRLFCFPFAGGGSAVFDEWGDAFSEDIEIVSVEAPGRLGRIDEDPVRTIEQFAKGLYPDFQRLTDRPYAVLGHCLGGLTLYEMLRYVQSQGDPMPFHIFVSGARPPNVLRAPGSFEADLNDRLANVDGYRADRLGHQQPDEVFAEIVRAFGISESSKMLDHEELRDLVLPTVRAEFEMTSQYIYLPERPFDVPITCFRGIRDDYFKPAHASLWRKFTDAEFEMFERDTGHFAIVEDFEFIKQTIEARMLVPTAASA